MDQKMDGFNLFFTIIPIIAGFYFIDIIHEFPLVIVFLITAWTLFAVIYLTPVEKLKVVLEIAHRFARIVIDGKRN